MSWFSKKQQQTEPPPTPITARLHGDANVPLQTIAKASKQTLSSEFVIALNRVGGKIASVYPGSDVNEVPNLVISDILNIAKSIFSRCGGPNRADALICVPLMRELNYATLVF